MGKHKKGGFRKARVCDCGDHGFVGLTRGLVSFFDADQVEKVAGFNWNALMCRGGVYARRANGGAGRLLHRFVTEVRRGEVIDHISGETLDNRSENLRTCSQMQNAWNQKTRGAVKSKGVSQSSSTGLYSASICVGGRRYCLGSYETEKEAAIAYYAASKVAQGEFRHNGSAPIWSYEASENHAERQQ